MPVCSTRVRVPVFVTISIAAIFLFLMPVAVFAQDLTVAVGDTSGFPGQQNSVITTRLTNYEDEVAAFEMWLVVENQNIMYFQTEVVEVIDTTYWKCLQYNGQTCIDAIAGEPDTSYWQCLEVNEFDVCIDSIRVQSDDPWDMRYLPDWDYFVVTDDSVTIGAIDTVGTLLAGWEKVFTRSSIHSSDTSKYYDVKVIAQANAKFNDGINTPGIPAGQVGGVLFRLNADIEPIDDTVTQRRVGINVLSTPADNFVFSGPEGGKSIGLAYKQFLDSNFYWCEQRETLGDPNSECLSWLKVSGPPYDSIYEVLDSSPYIDTMVFDPIAHLWRGTVEIHHGSLRVNQVLAKCGNVDGSEDGKINLADITYLISSVYLHGADPDPRCAGNVDCDVDSKLNLVDITRLIDHVYVSKTPLCPSCCSY